MVYLLAIRAKTIPIALYVAVNDESSDIPIPIPSQGHDLIRSCCFARNQISNRARYLEETTSQPNRVL
jgi:hypothetical protein